jgi:cytochrome b involved in lipid metabolism
MSKSFSASDVASHNKADNLWIIVDEDVYDLTKFQDEHPGGKKSKCNTFPVTRQFTNISF